MEYLCILNAYEQAFRMQDMYIGKMDNDCRLWQPWKDFSRKEETRLTNKELPTAKWRRDRRLRTIDYQQATTKHTISSLSSSLSSPSSSSTTTPCSSPSTPPLSPSSSQHSLPCNVAKPLNETTNTTSIVSTSPIFSVNPLSSSSECPIDMSVTSTTIKPRTPPPPYREPLPGSTFASLARPSVITQAPPKRNSDNHHSHHHHHRDYDNSISNRENDNCSTESISMCDPVIDEHFRRSLGADYMALFNKKSPQSQQQPNSNSNLESAAAISPNSNNSRTTITTVTNNESISSSVDDHFAKALGDTWKKLQAADNKDLKITDNNRSITPDIKNLNKLNREK